MALIISLCGGDVWRGLVHALTPVCVASIAMAMLSQCRSTCQVFVSVGECIHIWKCCLFGSVEESSYLGFSYSS